MGRVAVNGFLDLIWSTESIAEARASLINYKGLSDEVADRWFGHLMRAFPDGKVDISLVPDGIDLAELTKDVGDQHICALALALPARVQEALGQLVGAATAGLLAE